MKHLYLKDGSVNPDLLKRSIIIWGCGKDGYKLCCLLKEQKAEILAFCDSNCDLYGKQILGVSIMSCEEALNRSNVNLALAFHQWIDVIESIEVNDNCEIFADYLYEEVTGQETKCIICDSQKCTSSQAHFAPFVAKRMFDGGRINTKLIHCRNCDFWFSLYRPNDKEMERLYDGYWGDEYMSQRKKYEPQYSLEPYINLEKQEVRKRNVSDYLQKYIDFSAFHTLLDYGGDEGQYIPKLFDKAERYVYDISGNKVRDGIIRLRDLDEVCNKKFDFIMCCHVLEHVSDPIGIIEIMVSSLKDGGVLYIEVPNEYFFNAYSDVEINEHINFFRKDTIYFLAVKLELHIINVEINQLCKVLFRK